METKTFDFAAKKIDSTAMTYAEFIQKWNAQNTIEHAIALNKKWDTEKNGFVSILEYYNSGINNEVNHDTDQMTEAIIHTHPASTDASETNLLPPSAKDLQNLLEISSERHETDPTRFKCMHFTSSIVIANGYTFALTVTDREKAEQFLKNNPDFVNENAGFKEESAIGIIYNNTYKYLSSTYQGTDLEAYTLAHTLQEMDTGISLAWSKGNDGAFRSIRTMKDNENKNVIFIIYCS